MFIIFTACSTTKIVVVEVDENNIPRKDYIPLESTFNATGDILFIVEFDENNNNIYTIRRAECNNEKLLNDMKFVIKSSIEILKFIK